MTLTVLDVVRERLVADGYDGLCADGGECACLVGDLMPCGEMRHDCLPGHKGPCLPEDCGADGNCDWHIVPDKWSVNP